MYWFVSLHNQHYNDQLQSQHERNNAYKQTYKETPILSAFPQQMGKKVF